MPFGDFVHPGFLTVRTAAIDGRSQCLQLRLRKRRFGSVDPDRRKLPPSPFLPRKHGVVTFTAPPPEAEAVG